MRAADRSAPFPLVSWPFPRVSLGSWRKRGSEGIALLRGRWRRRQKDAGVGVGGLPHVARSSLTWWHWPSPRGPTPPPHRSRPFSLLSASDHIELTGRLVGRCWAVCTRLPRRGKSFRVSRDHFRATGESKCASSYALRTLTFVHLLFRVSFRSRVLPSPASRMT